LDKAAVPAEEDADFERDMDMRAGILVVPFQPVKRSILSSSG
jgi:hypothetical protein